MSILDMGLSDEVIIRECIDYIAHGMEIPLDMKVWLKSKGLLYLIENPVKEFKNEFETI